MRETETVEPLRRVGRAVGPGTHAVGQFAGHGARAGWRGLRRLVRAEGAGESGLASLIDLQAVNGIGDALVAVGLAGTLFFQVPAGEARPRVALYLLVTMAPFALLAPVIGPALDRFPHGRRYALGTTMLLRAFLAYALAGALHSLWLYPLAFGVLVFSRTYSVARGAVVPRLLPAQVSLVAANARLSLASVACAALAAPLGIGLGKLTQTAPLYAAAAVFAVGIVLALRLPATADSLAGAGPAPLLIWGRRRRQVPLGPRGVMALRVAASIRALNGFLALFLAFLLRTHHTGGPHGLAALGAVVAAAGLGSLAGTAIGARLRTRRPYAVQLALLGLVTVGCAYAAARYDLLAAIVVICVAGIANALAKLTLDAVIQDDVAEDVRASAFARSETSLQLAWVLGGGLGLLPVAPLWGFCVAAAALFAETVHEMVAGRRLPLPSPAMDERVRPGSAA